MLYFVETHSAIVRFCFFVTGKFGHVRYSVKATLVKPWAFNESTKTAFTVLESVALSKFPRSNVSTTTN